MTSNRGKLSGRRATQQEWMSIEQPNTVTRPGRDPTLAGPAHKFDLQHTAKVITGRIVDCIAYTHTYKVQPEQGGPTLPCMRLTNSATSAIGARDFTTYPPGTKVWLLKHKDVPYGLIMFAEPDFMIDAKLGLSDVLHQASRCGLQVDSVHSFPLSMAKAAGIVDWSCGRPRDGTMLGEWGQITETGLKISLDSFMAQVAASEAAGLFVFYHDGLVRLAGLNLEIRTQGSDQWAYNDEGEFVGYRGTTPYPWEHLGVFSFGATATRELTGQQTQIETPEFSYIEPAQDDQMPFHRCMEFEGYLGQGGKRLVVIPPARPSPVHQMGEPTKLPGVFEQHTSLTGQYNLRSAKAIIIAKQPLIAVPKQLRDLNDLNGDTEANYSAAGRLGHGDPHKVVGQVRIGEPTEDGQGEVNGNAANPGAVRAAAFLDACSYAFTWDGAHPFHYHALDWYLPQPSELDLTDGAPAPQFNNLHGRQFLFPPTPSLRQVDHRYKNVAYYPNESTFAMLDDGGVVLTGGAGESIKMVGGNIIISAPGDVWIKSGKNVIQMAGRDAITRAKGSAETSATDGSVRIKAERDVQILAGNSGSGGVLIESRSQGGGYVFENKVGDDAITQGVILRAANTSVVSWAKDVYLRTGGGNVADGEIVLDASRGRQAIRTHASTIQNFLRDAEYHFFGDEQRILVANEFHREFTTIGTPIGVIGYEILLGSLFNKGWVLSVAGHIATELAPQYFNIVPYTGEATPLLYEAMNEMNQHELDLRVAGREQYRGGFVRRWYDAGFAGNDTIMRWGEVSLRTSEQYGTASFAMYEDHWQQLSRLSGQNSPVWTEKAVRAGSTQTYPYPGKAAWVDNPSLQLIDLSLYDATTGRASDRPDAYESPQYQDPVPTTPDGNYRIVG